MNRSFGFRPSKSTLDALTAITSRKTVGMRTALEGDVEKAYDTVNKEKLIEILKKTIKDNKFIKLIRSRLDYSFQVEGTKERQTPLDGLPQGGIDSPIFWNIYMFELDQFVHTELQKHIDKFNSRVTERKFSRNYFTSRNELRRLGTQRTRIQKILSSITSDEDRVKSLRTELFDRIKKTRLANHRKNRIRSATTNQLTLRILYFRYADDWVLLTNGGKEVALSIKQKIAKFLESELGLKLSEKKTLVTEITKEPARFLGFEIRVSDRGGLRRLKNVAKDGTEPLKKFILCKKSSATIWVQPDKQRLINRFHM